jgi:hypothetical protein
MECGRSEGGHAEEERKADARVKRKMTYQVFLALLNFLGVEIVK